MIDSTLIFFVLLPASISDLYYYKVPNAVIFIGLFLSFLLRVLVGNTGNFYFWLIGGMIPFLLCFILYLFGAIGASDIKLFSVIGSFYNCKTIVLVIFISFCFGAFFSIVRMIQMKNTRQRLIVLADYVLQTIAAKKIIPYCDAKTRDEKSVIPFAVCISLAVMFVRLREVTG